MMTLTFANLAKGHEIDPRIGPKEEAPPKEEVPPSKKGGGGTSWGAQFTRPFPGGRKSGEGGPPPPKGPPPGGRTSDRRSAPSRTRVPSAGPRFTVVPEPPQAQPIGPTPSRSAYTHCYGSNPSPTDCTPASEAWCAANVHPDCAKLYPPMFKPQPAVVYRQEPVAQEPVAQEPVAQEPIAQEVILPSKPSFPTWAKWALGAAAAGGVAVFLLRR